MSRRNNILEIRSVSVFAQGDGDVCSVWPFIKRNINLEFSTMKKVHKHSDSEWNLVYSFVWPQVVDK
jgi:hypothetical protein